MNIVLDLILVAIVVFCTWNGRRKGLILGISGILALVVAFYGAQLIADTYSQEFTSMLKPFISGLVDTSSAAAQENAEEENKENDVYTVAYNTLKKMGIMHSAAEDIAGSISKSVDQTGQTMKNELTEKLCERVAHILTMIIVFFLIIIIFAVLANLLNLAFKMPGLEMINGTLGMLFGLAKGLIIVFAIVWLMRYLGFAIKESVINKTILLKWIMDHNIFTSIFGC